MDRRECLTSGLALRVAAVAWRADEATGATPAAAMSKTNGLDIRFGGAVFNALTSKEEPKYKALSLYDPLQCRVLQIGGAGSGVCFVSLDVAGVSGRDCARLRSAVSEAAGIPRDGVWIAWTHNHGPGGRAKFALMRKTALAALETAEVGRARYVGLATARSGDQYNINRRADAPHDLGRLSLWQSRHCTDDGKVYDGMGWAKAALGGMGAKEEELDALKGTVQPTRERDDRLQLLLFGEQDRPMAGIVRYTGRPVVPRHSPQEYFVTRDYFGVLVDRLEEMWGCPFVFIQGPCGDHRVRHIEQTEAEMRRIGLGLADLADPARVKPEWAALDRADGKFTALRCKTNPEIPGDPAVLPDLIARADAAWKAVPHGPTHLGERKRLWEYWAKLRRTKSVAGKAGMGVNISAVRLGPFGMVAFPAELGSIFSRQLQPTLGEQAVICGYVNGNVGYLIDADDYRHGGYEAWAGRVDPRSSHAIMGTAVELLTNP